MKIPDTNVLLHAVNADARSHSTAVEWLEGAIAGPGGVGFAWVALLGFMRISTRPGIFAQPLTTERAIGVVHDWLDHAQVRVVQPGPRHADLLGRLLLGAGTAGNLVNDAHLAALAIEQGATLGSFDRDMQRFAGLRLDLLTIA